MRHEGFHVWPSGLRQREFAHSGDRGRGRERAARRNIGLLRRHEEIVEVLPYFFWFAVWFGLLLGRRGAARVVCSGRSLCWAAAGAILGRVAFQMTVGDLPTPD